jgi:hypothetical protein
MLVVSRRSVPAAHGRSPVLPYSRRSPKANNARTADNAPPATAAVLAALNVQLGAIWFSYRTVTAAEVGAPDTRPGLRAGDA